MDHMHTRVITLYNFVYEVLHAVRCELVMPAYIVLAGGCDGGIF